METTKLSTERSTTAIQHEVSVAWERSETAAFARHPNFDDLDEVNKLPRCLSPLHFIWKLSGFTWHTNQDSTMAWTVWVWTYRVLTISFSVLVFFPRYFDGANSLLTWADETPDVVVRWMLIATSMIHGVMTVYPLFFGCWYIHNGHLHRLLQNLASTRYVDAEYINNELFRCIQRKSNRLRLAIYLIVAIQFIGWTIQNVLEYPHSAYHITMGVVWSFCWAVFKFLPFVAGLSVFVVVLEVLRIEKTVYIQQIAAAGNPCRCKENKLYFVFHDIDTGHCTEFRCNVEREEMEKHLNDSYLNLVGLCNIHGALWRWYVILLVAAMVISGLCAASLLYFCDSPKWGGVIMIPSFYVVLVVLLLYELADLNATTEDTLMLLSAVRLGECSTQNQMLKMMEYNAVQITCAGMVIRYNTVNVVAAAGIGLLVTSLIQSFIENGGWTSIVDS